MARSHHRAIRTPLLLGLALAFVAAAAPAPAQWSQDFWIATWATALVAGPATPPPHQQVRNRTFRQVVRTSMGGSAARVAFSNAFGAQPLTIGAASVALRAQDAAIVPASARALLFGGQRTATIPPGAMLYSDPVDFMTPSLGDVVIDVYIPDLAPVPSTLTMHGTALQTSYSGAGNQAGAERIDSPELYRSWILLSRLEVMGTPGSATIVVLGDSIADGTSATPDANRRWPDRLAERLTTWNSRLGVANMGIAGNGLIGDSTAEYGVNAQARFDRDVLAVPHVQHVVVAEGLNDIGTVASGPGVNADDLIAGYRQLIARAHTRGIRIYGATLTPFEGAPYYSPEGEAVRLAVNHWMHTTGAWDGVIDFDAVVRDATHPGRLAPAYDSGDHLHPNDAGYAAMGAAIPLEVFGPPSNRR